MNLIQPNGWLLIIKTLIAVAGPGSVTYPLLTAKSVSMKTSCVCVCVNVNIWLDLFVNVNKGNKRPPERQNKWMKKKRKNVVSCSVCAACVCLCLSRLEIRNQLNRKSCVENCVVFQWNMQNWLKRWPLYFMCLRRLSLYLVRGDY